MTVVFYSFVKIYMAWTGYLSSLEKYESGVEGHNILGPYLPSRHTGWYFDVCWWNPRARGLYWWLFACQSSANDCTLETHRLIRNFTEENTSQYIFYATWLYITSYQSSHCPSLSNSLSLPYSLIIKTYIELKVISLRIKKKLQ